MYTEFHLIYLLSIYFNLPKEENVLQYYPNISSNFLNQFTDLNKTFRLMLSNLSIHINNLCIENRRHQNEGVQVCL